MVHCADRLKEHSYYISMYISTCYCCLVVVVAAAAAAAAVAVIARCCLDVLSPPAAQYKNKDYIAITS